MKKKISKRKLDALWSTSIKTRAGNRCEICGKVAPLNSHHLFSRRYLALRWELDNGICLCVNHHFIAHQCPLEFNMMIEKIRPVDWIAKLIVLRQIIKPKIDLEAKEQELLNFKKEEIDI